MANSQPDTHDHNPSRVDADNPDHATHSSSRFRFKSQKRHRSDSHDRHHSSHRSSKRRRHHNSSSHHSPSNRRHHRESQDYGLSHSPPDTATPPPSTHSPTRHRSLTPETAFRESLFDALADDEGAAFWEGVYGQPVHAYPRPSTNSPDTSGNPGTEDAENVHTMNDDEYATYVRARMWEKTHEALLEERARRAEAMKRKKEEQGRARSEGGARRGEHEQFAARMEESLRAGERRRERKRWVEAWERYCGRWEDLLGSGGRDGDGKVGGGKGAVVKIPWPTASGLLQDLTPGAVGRFFQQAPTSAEGTDATETSLRALLKKERVRWHPDKMQQRLALAQGRQATLDEKSLAGVTAVFQVVDTMWSGLSSGSAGAG